VISLAGLALTGSRGSPETKPGQADASSRRVGEDNADVTDRGGVLRSNLLADEQYRHSEPLR